mgnify:CR=1 FL=1
MTFLDKKRISCWSPANLVEPEMAFKVPIATVDKKFYKTGKLTNKQEIVAGIEFLHRGATPVFIDGSYYDKERAGAGVLVGSRGFGRKITNCPNSLAAERVALSTALRVIGEYSPPGEATLFCPLLG